MDESNIETSVLPPLHSLYHTNNTSSLKSLIELKEEIQKLYPRVHYVELGIESIKKQIPSNLNKIFLQISSDIQKYHTFPFLQAQNEKDIINNEGDLSTKLKEIEDRLIMEIKFSMEKSSDDFNKKFFSLTKKRESMKKTIFNEFSNNNEPSNIQSKMQKFEEKFLNQEKKINSRLLMIENIYKCCKNDDFNRKMLQKYSEGISLHKNEINQIKKKLNEINEIINEENENIDNDQNIINDFSAEPTVSPKIEILSTNIDDVQNEIQTMIENFGPALAKLNEYSQELGNRMHKISNLSIFLCEKTKEIEQKSQDIDSKCQLMILQLSQITKDIGNQENNNELSNLSKEFNKVHTDIQREVENIRIKVKDYENIIQNVQT